MATLEQQIKEGLVETLGLKISADKIADDTPLFAEGLGLDSVDVLEIAAMLSSRFGVEIAADDSGRYRAIFANVRALANFVRERQAAKA
ncbi:MAG: acyl carrier protein [Deltaproteobacteria bacterium]|jgi:acyl carrier protein|nr:acyl carrier protein [Deltaproteobacteria bacterium]